MSDGGKVKKKKPPDLRTASREDLLALLTKSLTKNQALQKKNDGPHCFGVAPRIEFDPVSLEAQRISRQLLQRLQKGEKGSIRVLLCQVVARYMCTLYLHAAG